MITIRAATPADAPAIMQLHRESILALGMGHYSAAELESWAAGLVAERYVTAMTDETFTVGVTPDGALAGFCSIKGDKLKVLFVAPAWARRGVGSALLQEVESAIASAGHRRICTVAALSGQSFYEAHGYRVTEAKTWQTRGGLVIDVVAMAKALDTL